MRYPASEKLEIIRTVEASHLPTRQTLKMLGIPSSTYYDWYARWSDGGLDALADRPLKLSVLIGGCFSGIAALVSIVIFVLWLAGSFAVQGWTSTILSLWFLSGLILATLGIHGFYLGRVFREVQRRPRILVQTTTDTDNQETPGKEGL